MCRIEHLNIIQDCRGELVFAMKLKDGRALGYFTSRGRLLAARQPTAINAAEDADILAELLCFLADEVAAKRNYRQGKKSLRR
jgi:hypothetical protein